MTAVFFDREEVFAFHIPVFELKPPPQRNLRFRREIHCPIFASFGFFCPEIDAFSGKLHICDQKRGTLAQPHTAVQHEKNHDIISVFGKIGLIKFSEQLFQIFIGEEHFCLSIILQLANLLHGVTLDNIVPFEPVEEHSQIANVVVDCGDADRFSEVSAAFRVVLILREVVDIEGLFSSLLEVGDVAANQVFSHLVHAINFMFVATPSLKESQCLLVRIHGSFSQLGTPTINHKFVDLPVKIITFHRKTLLICWGKIDPINQECLLLQLKKFIALILPNRPY